MNDSEALIKNIDELKDKLNKAQRQLAGLRAKSKVLETQYVDSREREKGSNELVMELLERQRELNVMLNRSNIMLNRTQEAMALTSIEFNEIAKALPEPKKAEFSDRITKINDLFKKTGIQDAEMLSLDSLNPSATESLKTDELKRESEAAFRRNDSIWKRETMPEPPRVEAVLIEEEPHTSEPSSEIVISLTESTPEEPSEADNLIYPPRRKSWWRKATA